MYQLIQGDALASVKAIENASVDLIVTDPAYESLEKHRKIGTTTRLTKAWFPVCSNDYLKRVITELYRVLKNDSHCYIICDQETHYHVRDAAIACGFSWKKAVIWDKQAIGMGYSYRNSHEFVCYLEKGYRKLNNLGLGDVLRHKRIRNGYPTEKPVSLLKDLIENSSREGEVVLDCFAGSGSTLDAALQLNRQAIGVEISEEACNNIPTRLNAFSQIDTLVMPRSQMQLFG